MISLDINLFSQYNFLWIRPRTYTYTILQIIRTLTSNLKLTTIVIPRKVFGKFSMGCQGVHLTRVTHLYPNSETDHIDHCNQVQFQKNIISSYKIIFVP